MINRKDMQALVSAQATPAARHQIPIVLLTSFSSLIPTVTATATTLKLTSINAAAPP